MLENLDNITWAALQDAYGPANELPGLIRALALSAPELQEEILTDVWDRIWHHGRVTEVTPHAIPFLIELVAGGSLGHNLFSVLELLYYLGDGPTPWARETVNLKTYGEQSEGESLVLLKRERGLSPDAITKIFKESELYIKQSHVAVREELAFYLRLLESNEAPSVREIATWLTVVFPELAPEIAPRLRLLIDKEPDITVKATMIWSLGRLVCDLTDQENLRFFSRLAHSKEHPLIYFYAAAAYTSMAKADTPPEIAALVATGIYSNWDPDDFPPLPTGGPILVSDSIRTHGCRALSRLGAERAVPLLVAALGKINPPDQPGAYLTFEPVVDTLLDLAFGSRRESDAYRVREWIKDGVKVRVNGRYYRLLTEHGPEVMGELTDLQRQALEGVVVTEKLWSYEDNVYTLYGLPATREGLARLLTSSSPDSAC